MGERVGALDDPERMHPPHPERSEERGGPTAGTVMGDVPALGQHTDAVLEELGVAKTTIAAWRKKGVI